LRIDGEHVVMPPATASGRILCRYAKESP